MLSRCTPDVRDRRWLSCLICYKTWLATVFLPLAASYDVEDTPDLMPGTLVIHGNPKPCTLNPKPLNPKP